MHFSCSHEIGNGYGGREVRCSHGWRVTSPLGTPHGNLERRLRRMCERTHLHTPPHTHTHTHTQHTCAHTRTHTHFASHSPLTPSRGAPSQIPKSKWVPDKERPNCRTCRSEFNRLNRRCVPCLLLMQRLKCTFAQAACGWLAGWLAGWRTRSLAICSSHSHPRSLTSPNTAPRLVAWP